MIMSETIVDDEKEVLDLYRGMSDECQQATKIAMREWMLAFPRRQPASLRLVHGSLAGGCSGK